LYHSACTNGAPLNRSIFFFFPFAAAPALSIALPWMPTADGGELFPDDILRFVFV
jgi:hypothetical protein